MIVEELIIKDGKREIYGEIYYPNKEGKYPAVILSHGYNGSYVDFVTECEYYASNGFIAYTFDFCGGSMRSKSSGKATEMSIFTQKDDLLVVFDYISAMEHVDAERVYLFGGSQGGLVTALATEERKDKVRAMATYFPAFNIPADWSKQYPTVEEIPEIVDFWEFTLGKKFFADMHGYNPFENIGKYKNPVLILHGDQDEVVPLENSKRAVELYENAELIVIPGEAHGFTPEGIQIAIEKILHFLEEH